MISEAFETLKSNLELTVSFDEKIQARHRAVRRILEGQHPLPDTKLIGSVARKTRIPPGPDDVFDIDILMVLGSFSTWFPAGRVGGLTPDAAVQAALTMIQSSERYAAMSPEPDHPAVTISYQDNTKVEIVPAYLDQIGCSAEGVTHRPVGRGYWVPKQGRWELTDYDYDAQFVTDANTNSRGWVVPTVKMLKAIKRLHIAGIRSFHFEVLCVNTLSILIKSLIDNNQRVTYPYLINRFFHLAPTWFTGPIGFPASLTPLHYLTATEQQALVQSFGALARYTNAVLAMPEREQMAYWKQLFGSAFPSA